MISYHLIIMCATQDCDVVAHKQNTNTLRRHLVHKLHQVYLILRTKEKSVNTLYTTQHSVLYLHILLDLHSNNILSMVRCPCIHLRLPITFKQLPACTNGDHSLLLQHVVFHT